MRTNVISRVVFFLWGYEDVDGNWKNWLSEVPLRQLGDDLGLYGVVWVQMKIFVNNQ